MSLPGKVVGEMLNIYDSVTGKTSEISEHLLHPPPPHRHLILTHESETDLANLVLNWQSEFPGKSYLQKTLLQILVQADWQRLRADAAFTQLQIQLYLTGLPILYWDRVTFQHINLVQQQQTRAHRQFTLSLKQLEACRKPVKADAPVKAIPNLPPEPRQDVGIIYRQTAEVTVVDGKVTTHCDRPASYWLDKRPWPNMRGFCRQFYFLDAVVPDEYAYVLSGGPGVTHQATAYLSIYYSVEEFFRLCQLELDTNSLHLLGGEPLRIDRHT